MANVFELETNIDYSKFASLSSKMASIKGKVSSWDMSNDDPTIDKDPYGCCGVDSEGWNYDMNSEKQSVVADLDICIERINNITKAIECVIKNHIGLQESYRFGAPNVRRYREDGSLDLKEIEKDIEILK